MDKTLVIGSACADVTLYMEHLPSTEEDVQPKRQKISLGGCACNAAGILRLFEVPFTLFAPVGTGMFGEFVEQQMKRRGIGPVLRSAQENGACYCLVDKEGNRTFLAVHGAEYLFEPSWFEQLDMEEYAQIYVCGLELEDRSGEQILAFLEQQQGKRIFFAPGPRIRKIPNDRMERMRALHPLVHCNRREASEWLMDATLSVTECALRMAECFGNTAIVTDGGNPTAYAQEGMVKEVLPVKAKVIDGTGAGDSHIGAVMAMLAMGKSIQSAVETANRIGALAAETEGTEISAERFAGIRKEVQ